MLTIMDMVTDGVRDGKRAVTLIQILPLPAPKRRQQHSVASCLRCGENVLLLTIR